MASLLVRGRRGPVNLRVRRNIGFISLPRAKLGEKATDLDVDGELEAILAEYDADAPLAEAATIPAPWYTEARVADIERRRVFGRNWQLVARVDQVNAAGRYVTATVGGEPIVIVRGSDGVLRGFFNVCLHHAAEVMTLPEGRVERMVCPYHGWTYGLDGPLRSTPEIDGICRFDANAQGLAPVSVAIWEKWVFACVDAPSTSLEAYLGDAIRPLTEAGVGSLHFFGRRQWTIGCNWKVF